jgi:signal transduction histidine kinase
MVHQGTSIGAIAILRREVRPFTDKEIGLLQTFADQAVIAIENVRLFTELQTSNRELTEALDKQTATSEILRTIAHVQTDVQPVFDTIVRNAAQLCHAAVAGLFLTDGQMIHLPANYGSSPEALAVNRARFPRPLDTNTPAGVAILTRSVVHVADTEEPSAGEYARQTGRLLGFRSAVTVPMLREGEAPGAISVTRRDPGRFSDAEVALLQTFADQAVIAMENVRLFKELQARTAELTRSVGELTALGEVGQTLSSTLDLDTVLTTIVSRAVQLTGTDGGSIYEYDEATEEFSLRATHNLGDQNVELRRGVRLRKGEGVTGRMAITHEPVQVPDITVAGAYDSRLREALLRAGARSVLAVPLRREDHLIGGLVINRNTPGEFPSEVVELLRTFATQSALAIQNARLFREIGDKSRQLEAASRHKSEFLANMSHELRTPLNAVIGFSEVLLQRMFGELNAKQDEYLKDIYASGQHLLSLINDILDLSKIEAGRMELAPARFHLPSALENAVTLVKERAARHGIALQVDVDPQLGELVGDERKVKQVLLNLLSNAVKFTPEGGRIALKASQEDGTVKIAVTDTGIGIAPEDQGAIFEEFRQVGSDERKREGTGLGLTLAKKFVELHGGRIWVESTVGQGSTFTFTLPLG